MLLDVESSLDACSAKVGVTSVEASITTGEMVCTDGVGRGFFLLVTTLEGTFGGLVG